MDQDKPDVVRQGGIAQDEAQTEDVTRDTYGFPSAEPAATSRDERIEQANRAAEEAGIPGVELPEPETPATGPK